MSLDLCLIIISPIQFSSVAQFCLTLCDPMDCSMPGFPVHHQLPEPAQTHVCRVGDTINHLILCVPFYSCLQSFPASVFFQWVSFCIMWPKYWSFSFSISPSNEYLGLISFRMDWLDLLAVQGTLQESSLTPQFRRHQLFGAQLSLWSNSHIRTWLHTEYFICLKILCALRIHLPSSQTPSPWKALIWTFYCLCSSAITRMSHNWNYTICKISDWLLSFNNIHLKFFHHFMS